MSGKQNGGKPGMLARFLALAFAFTGIALTLAWMVDNVAWYYLGPSQKQDIQHMQREAGDRLIRAMQ